MIECKEGRGGVPLLSLSRPSGASEDTRNGQQGCSIISFNFKGCYLTLGLSIRFSPNHVTTCQSLFRTKNTTCPTP